MGTKKSEGAVGDGARAAERAAPFLTRLVRAVARDEFSKMAEPPNPIPKWLSPQPGELGDEDLMLVIETRHVVNLSDALVVFSATLADDETYGMARLLARDGSPWIEADVVISAVDATRPLAEVAQAGRSRVVKMALWRYTGAVYLVGGDGAVEDEPFYRPEGATS